MADIDDLTFADNPYDEDGVNLRLNPVKRGDTGDLVQRLELPDHQIEEIMERFKGKGLPTQVVHPWRTVARTITQHVTGLIVTGLIWLFAGLGIDLSSMEADLAVSLTIIFTLVFSAVATKIMALPQVEDFLVKYVSPLATGVADE